MLQLDEVQLQLKFPEFSTRAVESASLIVGKSLKIRKNRKKIGKKSDKNRMKSEK